MSHSRYRWPHCCFITACCVFVLSADITIGQTDEKSLQPEQEKTLVPKLGDRLSDTQVNAFAKLALKNIHTEYPNKPGSVLAGPESVQSPREMHPAFYGCFDWHSSVHGHWMLVRLLKDYPNCESDQVIRQKLSQNLTAEKIKAEVEFFSQDHNKSFERMYGWAWLFRLVDELQDWDDPHGKIWRENLKPLEALLIMRCKDYLPKLTFPIRTGQHPDTGFALGADSGLRTEDWRQGVWRNYVCNVPAISF